MSDAVFMDDWAAGRAEEPISRLDYLRERLLDSAGLDKLPDPLPLIDGILYRNSLAWLHGKPASGKSFVALDWAACVAGGLPWQEHETHCGPVLYVVAEGSSGMGRRKRAWEGQAREQMAVTFLPVAIQMAHRDDVAALSVIAAELKPVLIVLDTQARVTVGLEENSAKDMGLMVEAAEQVRASCGACVLFVHHEPRSGENLRGSTSLEGSAMTEIRAVKDGPHIMLSNPKQKEAEEFGPIHLVLKSYLESAVLCQNDLGRDRQTASQSAILCHIQDTFDGSTAVSIRQIIDTSGIPDRTVYRAVKLLVMDGKLVNVGTDKQARYKVAQP